MIVEIFLSGGKVLNALGDELGDELGQRMQTAFPMSSIEIAYRVLGGKMIVSA